jgi:hypothetical protein
MIQNVEGADAPCDNVGYEVRRVGGGVIFEAVGAGGDDVGEEGNKEDERLVELQNEEVPRIHLPFEVDHVLDDWQLQI